MYSSKPVWFLFLALCAASLGAFSQDAPQAPRIVDQTLSGTITSIAWATSEKWIAAFDPQGGVLRIFELATGRLSRQMAIPGANSLTSLEFIPARDQLVVRAGEISVYDAISGAHLVSAAGSAGCQVIDVTAGEITGNCTTPTTKMLRPTKTLHRVWSTTTGAQLREEESQALSGYPTVRDGTWRVDTKVASMGKMMLQSMKRGGGSQTPFGMFKFTVTDTATQKVVMEGSGQSSAISQKGQTIVVTNGDGLVMLQVPSGKQVRRLGGGLMNMSDGYSQARTVLGGAEYWLSGINGSALMDASSGEIKSKIADLTSRTAGFPSPTGTRIAFVLTGQIIVADLPDASRRQIIGNHSEYVAAQADASQAYAEMMRQSPAQKAVAMHAEKTDKETRKRLADEGKQTMKEEEAFEKTLPKRNNAKRAQMIEDHQREHARNEGLQTVDNTKAASIAMNEYRKATIKSYTTFGGPAMMPPEVDFLDSGRILAVLSADMSWSTWDVATGNRLPFRTAAVDYDQMLSNSMQQDSSKAASAMSQFLHEQLTDAVPTAKAVNKTANPRAVNAEACSSPSGDSVVDFKVEIDPKQWKIGKHHVESAILRLANGSTVDLLTKGVDVSAWSVADPNRISSSLMKQPLCGLSDGGQYLVVEKLSPDGEKPKHLSMREKVTQEMFGKQTADSLRLYDTTSGKAVCELEGARGSDALAGDVVFSASMKYVAAGRPASEDSRATGQLGKHPTRSIKLWDAKTCSKMFDLPGQAGGIVGFSEDEKQLYVSSSAKELGETPFGLNILDVRTGKTIMSLEDAAADLRLLKTTRNGRILFAAARGNELGFWDAQTGERLASLRALQEGEWLITTPQGYFDGSPRGWTQIAWRTNDANLSIQPGEIFFNEFYSPGLLAELLQGHKPGAPHDIQNIDRRQPSVQISADQIQTSTRTLKLAIAVEEAPASGQRKDGSGVRDVRLFRDGTLVRVWHGEAQLNAGKAIFEATVPVVSGTNQFVAYAFNRDNIKSADAALKVESTLPRRSGSMYVLTVGINRYQNPEFDLKFAVPDAQTLSERFIASQKLVGVYQNLVEVKLLDQEATKANISLALSLLSGQHQVTIPKTAPTQLTKLKAAQPEDSVVIYFAGHGVAWGDRFYLIPHDLGYEGPRSDLPASIQSVLTKSISDQELESAFEPMQAAQTLLIVDACNSGKALDSEEQRRGPLNSRGLAQLAYEKGMYILTAAQSYQAALESSRLGHGYLTYALAEEGLKTSLADTQPRDGKITAAEWFEYASRRVPELQMEAMHQASEQGRKLTFEAPSGADSAQSGRLQTPRFYYRRDLKSTEAIVASY